MAKKFHTSGRPQFNSADRVRSSYGAKIGWRTTDGAEHKVTVRKVEPVAVAPVPRERLYEQQAGPRVKDLRG